MNAYNIVMYCTSNTPTTVVSAKTGQEKRRKTDITYDRYGAQIIGKAEQRRAKNSSTMLFMHAPQFSLTYYYCFAQQSSLHNTMIL